MDRGDLQRLTKEDLIELVLKIERPEKVSGETVADLLEAAIDGPQGAARAIKARRRQDRP